MCGCRCEPCTASNRKLSYERVRAVRAAADSVEPNPGPQRYKYFTRVRYGVKYRVRGKKCPGTGGRPCVRGGAWLKNKRRVCTVCIERATVWNGLVPAARARAHLKALSAQGIGYKAVQAACDVAASCLTAILDGSLPNIRARTERRILAVDEGARADGSLVPAAPSYRKLDELYELGFQLRHISKELGYAGYATILAQSKRGRRKFLTARNAADIEKFYRRAIEGQIKPTSAHVDARPTYEIIEKLLKSFSKKMLKKVLGYNFTTKMPKGVKPATALLVKQFWEYVQSVRSGEPLPEGWQWNGTSALETAFGYEGGWTTAFRPAKKNKKRETAELRQLARRRKTA